MYTIFILPVTFDIVDEQFGKAPDFFSTVESQQ